MFRPFPRPSLANARTRRARARWAGTVEPLEGRSLLTTFTWISPVDGDFSDPTMWVDSNNNHGVPGPGDSAVTPTAPSGTLYTITSSVSTSIDSFAGGAVLDVSGGTFTVGASSTIAILEVAANAAFHAGGGTTALEGGQIAGDLEAEGGATIAFAGPTGIQAATSKLTGSGTFSVTSTLAVAVPTTAPNLLVVSGNGNIALVGSSVLTVPSGATLDWHGGSITGQHGSTVIAQGGNLVIEGSGQKNLDSPILNSGAATWSGGNIDISSGATFFNQQGGFFNLLSDSQITGGMNGVFTNLGNLVKSGTTGASTINVAATNGATGSLSVNSGSMTFSSLSNSGTIGLAPQTVMNVTGAFAQTSTGALGFQVSGVASTNLYGRLNVGGMASLGGTLNVTLGTVAGGGPFVPTDGNLYRVLTYALSSGNFSKVTLPSINGGVAFSTNQTPAEFDLVGKQTPPPAPTGLTLLAADDRNGPNATVLTQPRLTGKAQPGVLVQILDQNNKLVASAFADANGTFTAAPNTALAVGSYTLKAVAINSAGYGPNGSPYSLTIVARPPAPTGLTLLAADDRNGPNATVLTQPRLKGTAQPGVLVQILDQNNKLVASAFADANGTFTAAPTTALAVGSYSFKAVAIDSFGNYGSNGAAYTFKIVARPSTPTSLAIFPADDSGGPGVTAFHQPRLTGKAQPGLLVQIFLNNNFVASAVADATGTFVARPTNALAPGQYSYQAVAIDSFGNYGSNSTALSVTITPPPAAPTGLTLFQADDTSGSNATTFLKPRLTGKAQAGLLVQILDQNNKLIASAFADASGTFTAAPTVAFTPGKYTLKAVAIDAGGNYGANSTAYPLTIS